MIYLQVRFPTSSALSQILLVPPHPDEPTLSLLPDASVRYSAVDTLALTILIVLISTR